MSVVFVIVLLCLVTDNAANFKAGGELLMLKRKNLYWTPCAAHCIDLIFEDFEKELIIHQITIKNARKFTTYIYSRTMLITMVRKFTNGRDLCSLILWSKFMYNITLYCGDLVYFSFEILKLLMHYNII
jgi:hypothetical protein